MPEYDSIRGSRITYERKQDRQLSVGYLQLESKAAHALTKLRNKVAEEEAKAITGDGPGVPCVSDPESFSGDNLLSDRDAALTCAPCPSFNECKIYALLAHPAHGVYFGTVKRMEIPDD
jgi:hypothetical protein